MREEPGARPRVVEEASRACWEEPWHQVRDAVTGSQRTDADNGVMARLFADRPTTGILRSR
jgi:hypothetical protein